MFAIAPCCERNTANERLQLMLIVCGPGQSASIADTLQGPIPDLLVMDWSAGGSWGGEALFAFKRSALFENVPVVVAINSDAIEDAVEAYALGASCVIHKPSDWRSAFNRCDRVVKFAGTTLPEKVSHP